MDFEMKRAILKKIEELNRERCEYDVSVRSHRVQIASGIRTWIFIW